MTTSHEPLAISQPLITQAWLQSFSQAVARVGSAQLISERDNPRLVALAMLAALMAHQMLSEHGAAPGVVQALRTLHEELGKRTDPFEGEPATLEEMTVVMEMVATAFSLIDQRRRSLKATSNQPDVATAVIAAALLQVLRQACEQGGERVSASVLLVMRSFAKGYRAV